jgi:cytochrome c oxidase cbb3-type subunit III
MGPPLIDQQWIYGSDPGNIYESIRAGRSGGMPAYDGRLSEKDIWMLTAYLRAIAGLDENPLPEHPTRGWAPTKKHPQPARERRASEGPLGLPPGAQQR